MKKLMLLILSVFVITFSACDDDDDKKVTVNDLPQISKTFLETHFPGNNVLSVTKDNDSYEVYLSDGYKIEFTRSGNWDDIDGITLQLPESILNLLPQSIPEYVITNFPNARITEINKETYGYEIGLSTGLDLKFNSKGEFIGIDD